VYLLLKFAFVLLSKLQTNIIDFVPGIKPFDASVCKSSFVLESGQLFLTQTVVWTEHGTHSKNSEKKIFLLNLLGDNIEQISYTNKVPLGNYLALNQSMITLSNESIISDHIKWLKLDYKLNKFNKRDCYLHKI